MSHTHGLIQRNVAWPMEGGVPHDHLWFPPQHRQRCPRLQLRGVPAKMPLLHHEVKKELQRVR
jgi:hypothetical protein